MKVVILAGGFGTRFSEESHYLPKPLIRIGGQPILWHIMKCYTCYGFNDFIICAGYKQHKIKEWFNDYFINNSDVSFDFKNSKNNVVIHNTNTEPWMVTVVDTGLNTMTGGRIKRIQKYIGDEPFMLTYGDAVCDVDIRKLLNFHQAHKKLGTLTSVILKQEKGILDISGDNAVKSFREKQYKDGIPINAGFMVLEPEIFSYLHDDSTIFEKEPLQKLADKNQLMSYKHEGFWQCMDNIREKNILENLIKNNRAPWIKWD